MARVDPGEQVTELRGGDRHRAVGCARPQEAAPLQPLGKQTRTLAVMPDHLQEIASEVGSWQRFKSEQDPQQGFHFNVAIDQDAPAVCAHNLDPPTARSGTFSGGSGTISAGTNPGGTPSRPARYALRHENKT
jgi:hypothetical protein